MVFTPMKSLPTNPQRKYGEESAENGGIHETVLLKTEGMLKMERKK